MDSFLLPIPDLKSIGVKTEAWLIARNIKFKPASNYAQKNSLKVKLNGKYLRDINISRDRTATQKIVCTHEIPNKPSPHIHQNYNENKSFKTEIVNIDLIEIDYDDEALILNPEASFALSKTDNPSERAQAFMAFDLATNKQLGKNQGSYTCLNHLSSFTTGHFVITPLLSSEKYTSTMKVHGQIDLYKNRDLIATQPIDKFNSNQAIVIATGVTEDRPDYIEIKLSCRAMSYCIDNQSHGICCEHSLPPYYY